MATNFSSTPGGAPPKKKIHPLVWIFGGLAVFFVLMGLLVVAGGYFALQKARQAGLDPDLLRKNPALAAVNLALAANPDIEKLSVDEGRGTITVRDKKTGKVVTLNFDDVKNGRFSLQEEGKEAVSIQTRGAGDTGSVEVKSAEGTMKFGAGAEGKLPDWVPAYPGSNPQGAFSAAGGEGETGSFQFETKDSPAQVIAFYESALKKSGLRVNSNRMEDGGKLTTGIVTGRDESGQRTAHVQVTAQGAGSQVILGFQRKK